MKLCLVFYWCCDASIFPKYFIILQCFKLFRKKEEDARRALLNNPLKMKLLEKEVIISKHNTVYKVAS